MESIAFLRKALKGATAPFFIVLFVGCSEDKTAEAVEASCACLEPVEEYHETITNMPVELTSAEMDSLQSEYLYVKNGSILCLKKLADKYKGKLDQKEFDKALKEKCPKVHEILY